jgi:hypothetical protein
VKQIQEQQGASLELAGKNTDKCTPTSWILATHEKRMHVLNGD